MKNQIKNFFKNEVKPQFVNSGNFFVILLAFLIFMIINYSCLAYYGVFSHIPEKIFFELLVIAWILSPLLLTNNIFVRLYCVTASAITIFFNIVTLITGIIYRMEAAQTFWEVVASSSLKEVKEFMIDLPLPTVVFSAAGLMVSCIACIVLMYWATGRKYRIRSIKFRFISLNIPFCLCFIPFSIVLAAYCSFKPNPEKILKKTIALRYAYEFNFFNQSLKQLKKLNVCAPPLESLKFKNNTSDMLGVIVIGESASRGHLGCYGYARNTTPYFSKIKDELLLFDNVVASSPVTPDALKYFFTDAQLNDKRFFPRYSFQQIVRTLNAETFYISNQGRWGKYSMPAFILFNNLTETRINPGNDYDDFILTDFFRIINQAKTDKPRLIFLHLMGSHRAFAKRVPENEVLFNAGFRDDMTGKNASAESIAELNAYDSSIAYTDKILGKVIERLKKESDRPVFFLYFSDHGEVLNAVGSHKRSYECQRHEAFEIPFVLWFNSKYAATYPHTVKNGFNNRRKLAQTDRLLPSLCSLMQISWDQFPRHRDMFSEKFVPMKTVYSRNGKSSDFIDKNDRPFLFSEIKQ